MGGSGSTTATSSIDLCSVDGVAVNGCASGQASLTTAPSPHLRGTVGFAATAQNLAGWEYPMVAVWCYQDSDGDGVEVWPNEDDLVYMQLDHPAVEFVLGGGSSEWKTNGGAGDCWAMLYAYGNKGNNETIRELGSVGFHAEG